MPFSRRTFLKQSSAVAVAGVFQDLLAKFGQTETPPTTSGPLVPVHDETTGLPLLQLPRGFRHQSFGWTKDPMSTGQPTPGAHDGMAVIRADENVLTLCRNHEINGEGESFGEAAITYDPKGGGGCTNLQFDLRQGRFVDSRPSLAGTVKNCAGGPTPWGTWLSCEETVVGPGDEEDGKVLEFEREHGYIFEVPSDRPASAQPLKAMGRFVHEAVAVDPETSIVYETEDRGTAGLYRFIPEVPRDLAQGGRLQMMKAAKGDLRRGLHVGETLDTTWVDIAEPTRAHSPGTNDTLGVYTQGKAQGASTFARLEGCWYGNGKIYIVSTSGGEKGLGQVFEYDPVAQTIKLIFESPSKDVLDSPDNMTVSPHGGLLLCEDGSRIPQRLHSLTAEGILSEFAANNIVLAGERGGFSGDFRDQEWAGVSFSPDGEWLFANIQTPGVTFAIARA